MAIPPFEGKSEKTTDSAIHVPARASCGNATLGLKVNSCPASKVNIMNVGGNTVNSGSRTCIDTSNDLLELAVFWTVVAIRTVSPAVKVDVGFPNVSSVATLEIIIGNPARATLKVTESEAPATDAKTVYVPSMALLASLKDEL